MGIFTGTAIAGSRIDAYSPAEQELQCEGVDINFYEASMVAVAESEAVYNKAMKEIGIGELRYMEENGQEIVYEAVDVKAVFEKIKMFFKKLIDKVKAIFHAFIAKLTSFGNDDKAFVKKYRSEFGRKLNNVRDDFEFKGFDFKLKSKSEITNITVESFDKTGIDEIDDAKSKGSASVARSIASITKSLQDDREDNLETIRGNVLGAFGENKGKYDLKEFSTKLFELFRNGESSKVSIEKSSLDAAKICSEVETYASTKKAADDLIKKVLKSIDDAIKKIDDFSRDASKEKYETSKKSYDSDTNQVGSDGNTLNPTSIKDENEFINLNANRISYYTEVSSYMKSHREMVVQATGAFLQALKDRNRQWKAIMVKVIAGSDSKKMRRESYDYTNESYSGSASFLDSIVLK